MMKMFTDTVIRSGLTWLTVCCVLLGLMSGATATGPEWTGGTKSIDMCQSHQITLNCPATYRVRVISTYYRQTQECATGTTSFHSNFCAREESGNPACVGKQLCTFTSPWTYLQTECGYSNNFLVTYKCVQEKVHKDICSVSSLNAPSGHIVSPSYPERYTPGTVCQLLVQSAAGSRINVYLYDVYLAYYKTKKSKECLDRLWFSDGQTTSSYYCSGHDRGLAFTTATEQLYVYFTSSRFKYSNTKGFWIYYETTNSVRVFGSRSTERGPNEGRAVTHGNEVTTRMMPRDAPLHTLTPPGEVVHHHINTILPIRKSHSSKRVKISKNETEIKREKNITVKTAETPKFIFYISLPTTTEETSNKQQRVITHTTEKITGTDDDYLIVYSQDDESSGTTDSQLMSEDESDLNKAGMMFAGATLQMNDAPTLSWLNKWENSKIGIIVGGVVSLMVLSAFLAVIMYHYKRRQARAKPPMQQRHSSVLRSYDEVILAYDSDTTDSPGLPSLRRHDSVPLSHTYSQECSSDPSMCPSTATLSSSCRDLGPIDEIPEDLYREAKKAGDEGHHNTALTFTKGKSRSLDDIHSLASSTTSPGAALVARTGREMASISMSLSLDSVASTVSSDSSDLFPPALYETLEGIYTDVAMAHLRAHAAHNTYQSLHAHRDTSHENIAMDEHPSGRRDGVTLQLEAPYDEIGLDDAVAL